MAELEWGWDLGASEVRAKLELPSRVESVWVGPRLVSRSGPLGKPEGHDVVTPDGTGRLSFRGDACTLFFGGRIVAPTRSPESMAIAIQASPGTRATPREGDAAAWKPLVGLTLSVVIALGVGAYARKAGVGFFASREKQLERAAEELNKKCPIVVDEETRLDDAIPGPGDVFTYEYTLVKIAKEGGWLRHEGELTPLAPETLRARLEPVVTKKAHEKETPLRDHVALVYRYADKHGQPLFEIRVDP